MKRLRAILIWGSFGAALLIPVAAALHSPLLAWRDTVYVAASLAGVVALGLLLVQPLLAAGTLPGLRLYRSRRIHRWTGGLLLASVLVHVAGLWITSPPDVIDALLFVSPTPFSAWGVIAMWAIFATALLAASRRSVGPRWRSWRTGHLSLAVVIVTGSVVHAMLIEGTMETMSKIALCLLVVLATIRVVAERRRNRHV